MSDRDAIVTDADREALEAIIKHYGSNAQGETVAMRNIARKALDTRP